MGNELALGITEDKAPLSAQTKSNELWAGCNTLAPKLGEGGAVCDGSFYGARTLLMAGRNRVAGRE
ncbi:hypothetical protein CFI10_09035 [Marinobacterium iners]|nr:hypothetical protein CFI10_09035 [Marinobacterium iners]